MLNPFLRIEHISKKYGEFSALNDISIDIAEGEFICLLGPSGCGKTTLLRIIAGLEKPTEGKVFLKGSDATDYHPSKRNFGIVFQSYALFPNMTVEQNIAFGLHGRKLSKEEIREKVKDALDKVNLRGQLSKYPGQLSGGQQQRVALARALVLSPDFLLLDEPLSALDAKVRQKVRKEIKNLQASLGITTIMVTHDQEEALTMADRIVVMNNACVRQIGTPEEIYSEPTSPFVADFVGTINFLQTDLSPMGGNFPTQMKEFSYMLQAVRPEHVSILPPDDPNGLEAEVQFVEFHGSTYRIAFKMLDETSCLYRSPLVQADISSNLYEMIQPKRGDIYRLRMQDATVHYYPLNMDVEMTKQLMGTADAND